MMGGAAKILARGRELHDAGKYLLATEIVNKLVQAEPQNTEAAELLADSFEQLGYQQENPGLRNSFLAADLTLTINRADLEQTMMGAKTLDAQIADGTAKAVGNVAY